MSLVLEYYFSTGGSSLGAWHNVSGVLMHLSMKVVQV
jgi:hypothetical protein